MSINIKEIFKSDLDPNSTNWWANAKIDKINLNFNQLKEGGMPGPAGVQGIDGGTGIRGFQGIVGESGTTGLIGLEGAPGFSAWNVNKSNLYKNISPVAINPPEYSAVTLMIGKMYEETGGDYNNALPLTGEGSTAAVFYGKVGHSNFSLDSEAESVLKAHHYFSLNKLQIGKESQSTTDILLIRQNLNNSTLTLSTPEENAQTPSVDAVEIKSDLFKVNTKAKLKQGLKVSQIHYKRDAASNQVLVSSSVDGDLIWKNKYEMFGALPIGSIMSIRESDFNNLNFNIINTTTTESNNVLDISYGRGRINTPFEGWYLCHGQTWVDQGIITHEVPNLHEFSYNIESDGFAQDTITSGGDNSPKLIGSAAIDMDASYDNNSLYNITMSAQSQDVNMQMSSGSGFTRNRMIHLINLGEPELIWRSETQAAPTLENITLSLPQTSSKNACESTDQVYQWTGVGINWVTGDVAGTILYLNGQTATSNKWYEKDGIARYWKGTYWYSVQGNIITATCPIANNIQLANRSDVRDLNWATTPLSGTAYVINTDLFENATSLSVLGGASANPGWYRTNDSIFTVWHRRYWNGFSFSSTISENYVYYAGDVMPSDSYGDNCPLAFDSSSTIDVYCSTNAAISGIDSENYLQKFKDNNVTVMVNVSFQSNNLFNIGYFPLIKISEQNVPSSSFPWASLMEYNSTASTVKYGKIPTNNNSKISEVIECIEDPVVCYSYTVYNRFGGNHQVGYTDCNGTPQTIYIAGTGGVQLCSTVIPEAISSGSAILVIRAGISSDCS